VDQLRSLPSVEKLLQTPKVAGWITEYGRPLVLEAVRDTLESIRNLNTERNRIPSSEIILENIHHRLENWTTPTLLPVINATGVILHTNLGRAPLSLEALQAANQVESGYSTLEYDLAKGRRGSRSMHAEILLKRLSGAEAALVVNNNAAAVLLILSALARRRNVVIARSQLVEIGGGFRVPDVMRQSGAKLVEVGTTNRVHISDYEVALSENKVSLVMRAHRSNFRIIGFTSEPDLAEIVQSAHQAGVPVVDDLGSGSFFDTIQFGLGHEPMVQESLAAGVDLLCFSGDKLLGGPQAGIILGKAELVAKLKKHPLARAVRADKHCLASLSATLLHYLKSEALTQIPVWQMISESLDSIEQRAHHWIEYLKDADLLSGQSTIGGGSLPGECLPTWLVALRVKNPVKSLEALRKLKPPVIARLENDRLVLDPRTVLRFQEGTLLSNLREIIQSETQGNL
jgi:L-seryl-tRNA(Ser) seleniumtransferase